MNLVKITWRKQSSEEFETERRSLSGSSGFMNRVEEALSSCDGPVQMSTRQKSPVSHSMWGEEESVTHTLLSLYTPAVTCS